MIDEKDLIEAYRKLKVGHGNEGMSIDKIVRNMARDFARYCYRNTPVAKISKSEFYCYRSKTGKIKYLHRNQVERKGRLTRKRRSRLNELLADEKEYQDGNGAVRTSGGLRKVRIAKGYSRYSWIGIFNELYRDGDGRKNESPRQSERPKFIPENRMALLSKAITVANGMESSFVELTDSIGFNRFGTSSDSLTPQLIQGGFRQAADFLAGDFQRMLDRLYK